LIFVIIFVYLSISYLKSLGMTGIDRLMEVLSSVWVMTYIKLLSGNTSYAMAA